MKQQGREEAHVEVHGSLDALPTWPQRATSGKHGKICKCPYFYKTFVPYVDYKESCF